MISVSKNSVKQTIDKYLFQYKSIFKKRSFEIFYWLILSMLCLEEFRSVKFAYDNFIKKFSGKALNSIYFFLSYANFPITSLMNVTVSIALSLIPENLKNCTVFICADDTLQKKTGDNFDCYFKLFDHTYRTGNAYLNGHCFVALALNIPLWFKNKVRYLSLPIGYILYDKSKTKLEITSEIIDNIMPRLRDYKVVFLCDSWYTKGSVLKTIEKYDNLELIGAVRSDAAIFDLPPAPTGKRGRPRKKGGRLDIKSFSYIKLEKYYISTRKVMTRLFNKPVYVTVTTTDIENFSSVRLYICTINPEKINAFKNHEVENVRFNPSNPKELTLCAYSLRWNIEVIFYQHKFFWSFGSYMVRNKEAIERYVNLIAITFTLVSVLPFLDLRFSKYQFQSPQVFK